MEQADGASPTTHTIVLQLSVIRFSTCAADVGLPYMWAAFRVAIVCLAVRGDGFAFSSAAMRRLLDLLDIGISDSLCTLVPTADLLPAL